VFKAVSLSVCVCVCVYIYIYIYIVTCISDYRRVLDWTIGFIAPYTFTQFGTTGSNSAIDILHSFHFTVEYAQGFSVLTGRILATDFHTVVIPVSLSLQITREVFLLPSNSFLTISSQPPYTVTSRTQLNSNYSCVSSSLYSLEADP
jgi:hypothetical protein